jgi:cyclopropane fatty-acyl-phospholipid synthase-like methyltransferase
MDYDKAYGTTPDFFGTEPDAVLVRHWELLETSRPVLDIGCGQGRNTLFLARKGLQVDALDPSRVAVETVAKIAARENLPVHTIQSDFYYFAPAHARYSGILVFGLIPELQWETIDSLVEAVTCWIAPAGLLWVTAFTTSDPAFAHQEATWEELATNSFRGPEGQIRTYLLPGQVQELFPGFEAIDVWEGLGPEHRHGEGPPERHARTEAVFRRTGDAT